MPPASPRVAVAVLVGCCALWGLTFPIMPVLSAALARVDVARPEGLQGDLALAATTNAWRFAWAAIVALPLAWSCLRRPGARRDLGGGLAIAACVAGGLLLQNAGLRYLLPSTSGVLTALYVLFGPLAQALVLRRRVGAATWIAAGLALGGISILAWGGDAGRTDGSHIVTPPFPFAGEALTILGSLVFTGHILAVDRFGARGEPARVALAMFVGVAVFSALIALVSGGGSLLAPEVQARLACDPTWLAAFATLVVLCTVVTMTLMNRFQPAIPPAAATVVYCLEPVFATLASLVLGQERLTTATTFGGGLVIGGMALVALRRRPAGDAHTAA